MTTRCNSLLLGVLLVLVFTSVILGLFIGLLDSVKVVNEPIDGSFISVESRSKYSKILKKQRLYFPPAF